LELQHRLSQLRLALAQHQLLARTVLVYLQHPTPHSRDTNISKSSKETDPSLRALSSNKLQPPQNKAAAAAPDSSSAIVYMYDRQVTQKAQRTITR
jgi:hypothetical protein